MRIGARRGPLAALSAVTVALVSVPTRFLASEPHEDARSSKRVRGGRRRGSLGAIALVPVLGAMLALSSTPALAAEGHFYQSSFGSFTWPGAVTVDPETHDVYVVDLKGGTVSRFNEKGEPVNFSKLGTNALTGFSFYEGGAGQVAIDSSTGPDKGDIYVANTFANRVEVFNQAGERLSQLDEGQYEYSGKGWGLTCGVAVDKLGNLYVSIYSRSIVKFAPTSGPMEDKNYAASIEGTSGTALQNVCTIAVDGEGNIWAAKLFNHYAGKFDALQFGSPAPTDTELPVKARSVAVDQALGRVYFDTGSEIVEDDTTGAELGKFGQEWFKNSYGMGESEASGAVYVSDSEGSKEVEYFSPLVVLPDIAIQAPTNLTETSVTLNAKINPDGTESTCNVEWGEGRKYGHTVACSPANLGAGNSPVEASVALSGLTPDQLYHYRFVTTGEKGVEYGNDQTVRAGHKPNFVDQGVLQIGISSATVTAHINPMYFLTKFHYEYGTDTSYGSIAPVPDSSLGSIGASTAATWTLTNLHPATVYHFRIVASDAFGTVTGPDEIFTTYPKEAGNGSCANGVVRSAEQAAYLPDCRAFELASPVDKGSGNASADPMRDRAAESGGAVAFYSSVAFGQPEGSEAPGAEYIAQRGAEGWTTNPINPPSEAPENPVVTDQFVYMTPDLSHGVFYALTPIGTGHPNVALTPNLYLRDNLLTEGIPNYELLTDSVVPIKFDEGSFELSRNKGVYYAGATADMNHIVFESSHDLTEEAKGMSEDLTKAWEWHDGQIHMVSILPNSACGTPPCAAPRAVIGNGAGGEFDGVKIERNPISADGSKVFFTAGPNVEGGFSMAEGNIYARIDGTETVQINVSERTPLDPEDHETAIFQGASADGSKVVFSSRQMLTNDVEGGNEPNLYMYDFNAPAGKHLTLISKDTSNYAPCGCGTPRFHTLTSMTEDASFIYFLSSSTLLPGEEGEWPGADSILYVWHNGTLRSVAGHPSPGGRESRWGEGGPAWAGDGVKFRMTPDGNSVMFLSQYGVNAERAGFVNESAGTACGGFKATCYEVYVYNYAKNTLVCASCKPAGDAPAGEAAFTISADASPVFTPGPYLSHAISDNGKYVFFESTDKLLPQARNGRYNVYEYNTETTQLHMLDSGNCDCNAYFVDASSDGSNAFIQTHEKLVSADTDTNGDLYDVRINGGFLSQNEAPVVPCTGDACAGPAEHVPNFSVAASATFNGVGNPLPILNPKREEEIKKQTANAKKLAKALKACKKKKSRKKRAKCQHQARKRFKVKSASRLARR